MEEKLYIEQMITGSFVKYNRLSQLIQESYAGSNATEINFFIDLHSTLKQMYSIDGFAFKYNSPYEITSSVLNMCGHYREFFRLLGVKTNIYIIWGLNCPGINDTFVKGYNSKFVDSYIKKPDTTVLINDNLKILSLITQYLPGIYFFDIGNNEVSAMIDHLIKSTNAFERGIENIVLTKDILALQLIPEHNVRVLRPVKTKDGDESFIADNRNLWEKFSINYRKVKTPVINPPTTYFSNALAMSRVPERCIPSALSMTQVYNIFDIGIKNRFLDPTKLYTQSSMNSVITALGVTYNPVDLEMRYKAINTHFQSTFVLMTDRPDLKRLRLVDLEDVNSLKEIISKYFYNTPIDLDRL